MTAELPTCGLPRSMTLPERVLKFALNSLTGTLPHNANLHLWKKLPSPACNLCGHRQTLLHVLTACPYSLEKRRFNTRHEVGSRGFFYCSSFDSLYSLYRLVPSRRHEQEALETGIVQACLQERTESGAKRIGKRQRSSPELHACTTQQPDLLTTDTNYL